MSTSRNRPRRPPGGILPQNGEQAQVKFYRKVGFSPMVQYHQPVMLQEVRKVLQVRPGDYLVDCNLGTGGHALALLEDSRGEGFLVGLDLDNSMLKLARERFSSSSFPPSSYSLVQADHGDLAEVIGSLGQKRPNRILFDLGASSPHYDTASRGFSCANDGELDMRYARSEGQETAADIVNTWPESDLSRLFKMKGDERWAARIAKRIVARRATQVFERTGDLAQVVGESIPRKAWPPKIHPATRVFLALRVEVNGEDVSLRKALQAALDLLEPEGRMAVLTFQSHEDRAVKRFFRGLSRDKIDEHDPWGHVIESAVCNDLTRRPLRPSPEECESNPRARSTKLRAVEKRPAAAGSQ